MLIQVGIVEESLLTAIEGCRGKGKLVGGTMIMGNLNVRLQSCAKREAHISALIMHRILGIHAHQSTLSVHTIKSALRTTQHVDTVNPVEMTVERTLADEWDIVVIHPDSRIARTATYTTNIGGGSESRTIGG